MRFFIFVLAAAGATLTASCSQSAPEGTPPPLTGEDGSQCNPTPARVLVGQTASAETGARALALTGAKGLRWGPPRSAFTMDYSPTRVNVMYDDAMRITETTCG